MVAKQHSAATGALKPYDSFCVDPGHRIPERQAPSEARICPAVLVASADTLAPTPAVNHAKAELADAFAHGWTHV